MMIRNATLKDAPVLARVRQDGWKHAYRGIVPDAVLDGMDYEKEVRRWQNNLADPNAEGYMFAAEIDGQVAGFCGGGPCRDDDPDYDGEVYAIYVDQALQRRGVGQALTRAGMDWLRERGCQKMLIWVLRENHPARSFYEKLGGAPVRQRLIQIGGVDLPEMAYGFEL